MSQSANPPPATNVKVKCPPFPSAKKGCKVYPAAMGSIHLQSHQSITPINQPSEQTKVID